MLVSALAVLAASTPVRLLLAGVAVAVGVVAGLVPALVLGMALDLVPRPRALRGRRGAHPALQAQPAPSRGPVRPVAGGEPPALDVPAVALPASMRQRGGPEPLEEIEASIARDRHRRLYDDEYAKQLAHLDTLRRAIRTRLAVGAQPLGDDRPRES